MVPAPVKSTTRCWLATTINPRRYASRLCDHPQYRLSGVLKISWTATLTPVPFYPVVWIRQPKWNLIYDPTEAA